EALASDEALAGGLGVLRIAELVDQDKGQVSRTLRTLAEHGVVDRDPETRAYRIGWSVFALAARAGDMRLVTAGEPVVRELAQALGERVHLTVLQGTEVLTILSHGTPHAIEAAGWVGRTVPAHCTSSGYALLLDADVAAALAGVELAPHTVARVKTRFAGINPADLAQRAGAYPAPPGAPQDVPGMEVAGTVVAKGDAVRGLAEGDRVFGLVGGGGLADRVVVHERHATRVPDALSDEE